MKLKHVPHFLALAAALFFTLASAQGAAVISITPAPNAVNVPPTTPVRVTFSDPIDPGSVAAGVGLTGSSTGPHGGSVTWNNSFTVLTFVPNSALAKGEPFTIGVSSQVTAGGTPITPWVSQFTVASNPNDGKFSQGITFETGLGPASACLFDVDGDGFIDITAGNSSEQLGFGSKTISFLKGLGNCQFAPKADYITGTAAYVMPWGVAMGRLRPNGPVCAVVANWASASVAVLPFVAGAFGPPETIPLDSTPVRVVLADIDGDGYLDIVVGLDPYIGWAHGVRILFNDGNGNFPAAKIVSINPGNVDFILGMAVGDVNGDGLLDVLTTDFSFVGHFSVILNQGNRTFASQIDYPVGLYPKSLAVADFDGDGKVDVAVANRGNSGLAGPSFLGSGSVTIYRGRGDGTFGGPQEYRVNGAPDDLVIADLTGDGHPDIATANVSNDPSDVYAYRSVSILINNSVGLMTRREDVAVRASGYPQPWSIAAGDVDNDGDLDLVTANWNDRSVSILRNTPANISGTVYRDSNNDCLRDPNNGEIGVGGRLVKIEAATAGTVYYEMPKLDGTFAAVVPAGDYSVSSVDGTCAGLFGTTPITGREVGRRPVCTGTVSCYSRISWPCPPGSTCEHGSDSHRRNLCPCEPFQYAVTIVNTGTEDWRGVPGTIIRLKLPPEVMFCSFPDDPIFDPISPTHPYDVFGDPTYEKGKPNPYASCASDCDPSNPQTRTGQNVIWRLKKKLERGESCTVLVNVQVANVPMPPSILAPMKFLAFPSMQALCKDSEAVLKVKGDPCEDTVSCSYDPNDLTVSPAGCGPNGNVPEGTTFTYRLRFQNLGTAPALRVVVRNHLDPDLDPSTLEILSTSHPVTDFKILPGQQMTWTFDLINLPDAATDEMGSRGEIRYRIRPKSSAGVGTAIHNSADIYFDLNAPVTTVTTLNTITGDVFPMAAFDVKPRLGSPGLINDFVYTGGTVGATFLWDFGEDATPRTSTQQNPSGVVFGSAGQHFVTLRTSLGDCPSEPAVRIVTSGRPFLAIDAVPAGPLLSWEGDGYRVQETDSLTPPILWRPVSAIPLDSGGDYSVQLPPPSSTRFYRLEQAP